MSENTRYTTTDQLANVPHPAGATKVDDWFNPDALIGTIVSYVGPDTARYFTGTSWVVDRDDNDEDIDVSIEGEQYVDGRVQRHIVVHHLHGDEPITPGQARQLAAALTAAADECEQMAGYDRIELAPASVDLSRYSVREVVDELIGRLGVDEVCRQLDVASVDELNQFAALADGDRAARANKP